jgi:signal recognition particle subunit SRP72
MATSTKSLSALLAQASLEDHDEVLKAANAAVKKSKTDVEAHHVKAIALLHLDRYQDALDVLEHTPGLQEMAVFEYAYALYKTGNAAKAVDIAGAAGPNHSRGMKHMLAQAVRCEGHGGDMCMCGFVADACRPIAPKTSPRPQRCTRN